MSWRGGGGGAVAQVVEGLLLVRCCAGAHRTVGGVLAAAVGEAPGGIGLAVRYLCVQVGWGGGFLSATEEHACAADAERCMLWGTNSTLRAAHRGVAPLFSPPRVVDGAIVCWGHPSLSSPPPLCPRSLSPPTGLGRAAVAADARLGPAHFYAVRDCVVRDGLPQPPVRQQVADRVYADELLLGLDRGGHGGGAGVGRAAADAEPRGVWQAGVGGAWGGRLGWEAWEGGHGGQNHCPCLFCAAGGTVPSAEPAGVVEAATWRNRAAAARGRWATATLLPVCLRIPSSGPRPTQWARRNTCPGKHSGDHPRLSPSPRPLLPTTGTTTVPCQRRRPYSLQRHVLMCLTATQWRPSRATACARSFLPTST